MFSIEDHYIYFIKISKDFKARADDGQFYNYPFTCKKKYKLNQMIEGTLYKKNSAFFEHLKAFETHVSNRLYRITIITHCYTLYLYFLL